MTQREREEEKIKTKQYEGQLKDFNKEASVVFVVELFGLPQCKPRLFLNSGVTCVILTMPYLSACLCVCDYVCLYLCICLHAEKIVAIFIFN